MKLAQRLSSALFVFGMLALGGCGEDKKTEPLPHETLSGAWVGTWAVTTTVSWSGTGECPSDTLMSTTIAILDGDEINDVLERISPSSVAPYVHLLDCPMDQTGNDITFSCRFQASDGSCFVSTTNSGSGSADDNSFTLTVDGDLSIQGSAGSCGQARSCSFYSVTEALKVGAKGPFAAGWASIRGVRYN